VEHGHQLLFSCLTITRTRAQFSTPRAPESTPEGDRDELRAQNGPLHPVFQVEGHLAISHLLLVDAAPSAV